MSWWKFVIVAICHWWATVPVIMIGYGFALLPPGHPAKIAVMGLLAAYFWPALVADFFMPGFTGGWLNKICCGRGFYPLLPLVLAVDSLIWSAVAYPAGVYGYRLIRLGWRRVTPNNVKPPA